MEIEFEFEMEDWMNFQKNYLQKSKQFKRSKITVAAIFPLVVVLFTVLDLLKEEFSSVKFIFFGGLSILWIIYYPKYLLKKTLDKTKKMMEDGDSSGILGRHKIILNNEGFIHIAPESEQTIKWSGIKKIEESNSYYFLYNTAVSAIIIPKDKILNNIEQLDKLLKNNIA
jgi:hypothetical protein